jgi:hypothetical protein
VDATAPAGASAAALEPPQADLAGAAGLVFLIKARTEAFKFPATVRALKPGAHKAAIADMATQ